MNVTAYKLTGLVPWTFVVALVSMAVTAHAAPLRLVQTIPLPGIEGRIDHMAVDLKVNRLYLSALGNDTVEVVDLRAGHRLESLRGMHEPQGVGVEPRTGRLLVANGGDGTCRLFDESSLRPVGSIPLGDDADDVRVDAATGIIYVGYGGGALAFVDPRQGRRIASVPLAGHPEAFEAETIGSRLFVNVPTAGQIAVIDRQKRAVVATWPVTQARSNFPMALDEANHRLFIGCRDPARVLVYDTRSGKVVASASIAADTDDLFWDAARSRLYASCGAGYVDVLRPVGPTGYESVAHVPTAPGALTSLFVPALERLFVAVPHRGGQGAEIKVFSTVP